MRACRPQSVAQGSAFGLQGGGALKCGRSVQSWPGENLDIQVVSKVFLRETRRNLGSIGGFSALEKILRSPGLGFERAKWRKWELKSWIFMKNRQNFGFSYFSSSGRIRTAFKGCGIDRAVKVRRKCVFGCVYSMPGGRFTRFCMIFGGFGKFGLGIGNVEKS